MENFETFRLDQTGQQTQAILDQVSTNTADIAQLRALYEALTQSEPVIIQPSDTWPVADPEENVIYRVIDRVNTPPQSYSDYMWNGTAMVLMATYNNSIDNEPTPGSNNLVKSGGVAASIVFDISAYHATGSTLATYANLAAALGTDGANVPASVRKGGMSVKFVQSSDNKYVQYRLTTTVFSSSESNWQKQDTEIPDIFQNSSANSDLDISDQSGNVIARFKDGNIKTKNFNSGNNIKLQDSYAESNLDISDQSGNVIARFKDGNIKTKNFDSGNNIKLQDSYAESNLDISDQSGNVIVRFKDGNIKTKNFDSQNLPGGYAQFFGKKISFLGDSITYGDTLGADTLTKRWTKLLCDKLGAIEINLGANGTTVANYGSGVSNYFELRCTSANIGVSDLVFIFGGTNDFVLCTKALGDVWNEIDTPPEEKTTVYVGDKKIIPTNDQYTFDGAYNNLIAKIKELNSSAYVVLVTPMHRHLTQWGGSYYSNQMGNYMQEYVDAIKKIGLLYGFPVIDLWNESNFNTIFSGIKAAYFNDDVHPNVLGHKVLSEIMYENISKTIFKN